MGAGRPELSLVHAVRRAEAADHPRRRRRRCRRQRSVTRVPSGHPEGYLEGFANIYPEAARAIRAARKKGGKPPKDVIFPTVQDGVEGVAFVEACVKSSKKNGAWTKLEDQESESLKPFRESKSCKERAAVPRGAEARWSGASPGCISGYCFRSFCGLQLFVRFGLRRHRFPTRNGISFVKSPDLSVIIPCRNEAANLPLLLDEIDDALAGRDFEVIVVDDGSTDGAADVLARRILEGATRLRVLRHDRSAGQSVALRSGVLAARGPLIATMDGDGQNNPIYLPKLADALASAGPSIGIAAGQRLKRTDTKVKQWSSRFANGLRQSILADGTRNSGCGLKAIHTDLFRRLPYFDGWHRYLPALVLREGFGVVHIDVVDRARRHGKSNYGILDRGLRGALDLFGVWWLRRRRRVVPVVTEETPRPD